MLSNWGQGQVNYFLFFINFFLRQDHLSSDVPPHLTQPCYVAIGRALIWGLYPYWLRARNEAFVIARVNPLLVKLLAYMCVLGGNVLLYSTTNDLVFDRMK